MTAIIIIGLISLAACLASLFATIEQMLKDNDNASATAYLWMMWTFTVSAICAITYVALTI